MQKTATDFYEWTVKNYPGRKIIVMGHSYGSGISTYLASEKQCDNLILLTVYGNLSDLYNQIVLIFWGPLKIFISNNIEAKEYAKNVACITYIIGSTAGKTLSAELQKKMGSYFSDVQIKIFDNVDTRSVQYK